MRHFLLPLLLVLFPLGISANNDKDTSASSLSTGANQTVNNPKFSVTPNGRLLIDGALYASPQKYMFSDGMAISEARVGVKMGYGKWSSWIDVGFAYGKIGLRNMWIQYDFNSHNSIRVGNFLMPFGYQSPLTANNKPTFEQPLVSALYTPGLQLGLMYTFRNQSFYSATAVHMESSALTNVMNYPQFTQQGYSLLTRFVWRNRNALQSGAPIINAGISLGFSSPDRHLVNDEDIHDGFTNSANFPTKVSNVTAISATVANAKNRFKLTPELALAYGRIGLESQYFFQTIARRKGLPCFNSQGAYVTLRGILIGSDYTYDEANAQLVNPKKNALELVLDYNYASLSDSHAGIYGGRANSFNATLNYYFNQYITARLNYSYTHAWDRAGFDPITQNAFQLRLMVLF
ncbi:MAG: ATPase [Muribaculaceae bacterium]|nr:ATPase [Muribaculaceae bacterium]